MPALSVACVAQNLIPVALEAWINHNIFHHVLLLLLLLLLCHLVRVSSLLLPRMLMSLSLLVKTLSVVLLHGEHVGCMVHLRRGVKRVMTMSLRHQIRRDRAQKLPFDTVIDIGHVEVRVWGLTTGCVRPRSARWKPGSLHHRLVGIGERVTRRKHHGIQLVQRISWTTRHALKTLGRPVHPRRCLTAIGATSSHAHVQRHHVAKISREALARQAVGLHSNRIERRAEGRSRHFSPNRPTRSIKLL